MYRLSLIISEVYNKYLPLAEQGGISLNLDFSDTTRTIADPDTIKADLDKHLDSALSRSERGEINISVEEDAIVVTDSGTILSKPICALLSKGRVSVASRVGFGTTVRISLLPAEDPTSDPAAEPTSTSLPKVAQPAPKLATKSKVSASPISKTKSKTSTSSKSKSRPTTTREQRKLTSAAKKADRKIQKLRKSQQKQAAKQQKQVIKQKTTVPPKKVTKQKPAKKPRKKVIEFS